MKHIKDSNIDTVSEVKVESPSDVEAPPLLEPASIQQSHNEDEYCSQPPKLTPENNTLVRCNIPVRRKCKYFECNNIEFFIDFEKLH